MLKMMVFDIVTPVYMLNTRILNISKCTRTDEEMI